MKKINCLIAALLLLNCLVSCDDKDDRTNAGFEVPELTLENTIQFTVNASERRYADVLLQGDKIAVDWGDGEITKYLKEESGDEWRPKFEHVYKGAGVYTVKIWADEVTDITLSSFMKSYEQLHIGTCPVLKNAVFNSFSKIGTLNLNGCKRLNRLELSNMELFESVALDECGQLDVIILYTNPKLADIDLSKNDRLTKIESWDCGLETLKLPKSIVNATYFRNKIKAAELKDYKQLVTFICNNSEELTSLDFSGCDNLANLEFNDTNVGSFDFSKQPGLKVINCSGSKLESLDVSGNKGLTYLNCSGMGLASLDITNNTSLRTLYCGNNKLTALDVSGNKWLSSLYIDDNMFDKENLEAVFIALPKYDPQTTQQRSKIKILGNPGMAECDTKIITDKWWLIINE